MASTGDRFLFTGALSFRHYNTEKSVKETVEKFRGVVTLESEEITARANLRNTKLLVKLSFAEHRITSGN